VKKYLALASIIAVGLAGSAAAKVDIVPSLDVAPSSALVHGGHVEFDAVYGETKHFEQVYVTVVCSQDTVVYQWSADPAFSFPLVQQDGLAALGLVIDTTRPMTCEAWLIERLEHGPNVELTTLDTVGFEVI
jgi:hypothetical protein